MTNDTRRKRPAEPHGSAEAVAAKQSRATSIAERIEALEHNQKALTKVVNSHSKDIDNLCAYSRKYNLRLTGIDYKLGENLKQIIGEIFVEGLKVDAAIVERLVTFHRIDRNKKTILLRFVRLTDRDTVIRNCKNLKEYTFKEKAVFFYEDLTKSQQCEKIKRDAVFTLLKAQGMNVRKISFDKLATDNTAPCHYSKFNTRSTIVPII